jgi:hypothetical protein
VQDVFSSVDYDFASGLTDILDFFKENLCAAGSNAVDAFDGRRDQRSAYPV